MTLRTFILIFCFFIIGFSHAQKKNCRISGSVSDENFNEVVYLVKGDKPFLDIKNMEIVDSVNIYRGIFSFHVSVPFTDYYSIRLKNFKKGFIIICSPGSNIVVKSDTAEFYFPMLTGSKENDLRKTYFEGLTPLVSKMNSYADSSSYVRRYDSVRYSEYVSLNVFWSNKIREYNLCFISKYPKCLTSLNMYSTYYKLFSDDSVRIYLRDLPRNLRDNPLALKISERKFKFDKELIAIKSFSDFYFLDSTLNHFKYEPYIGKIVLVDFWATWCKPCIENFSYLKALSAKINKKDFQIIGVSLDKSAETWLRSLRTYQPSWLSIIDPKSFEGLVTSYFDIQTIPRYILLGKDGKVLNINLEKENIEAEVLRYLKE